MVGDAPIYKSVMRLRKPDFRRALDHVEPKADLLEKNDEKKQNKYILRKHHQ